MYKPIQTKFRITLAISMMIIAFNSFASTMQQGIKNQVIATFKVSGNCDMCKNSIEGAVNKKRVVKSEWDADSKILSVTYNSKKTNADEILKRVAYAGYDNEKYLAPEDAYVKLDGCCKYERQKTAVVKTASEPKKETAKQENTNLLSNVYKAYFDLKDALVKNDGVSASNKAKELFKAIEDVPMEKMPNAQHIVWMKFMAKLSYDAEQIKGVADTEHQREYLNSLSKNLFEVMKVIKPSYPVYLDHCPMYNDGKGADWISKEAVIKNPYYGSKMLSCGKITETLK